MDKLITTNIFEREMTILSNVMLKAEDQNGYNISTTTIGEFLDPKRQIEYIETIWTIRALCPTLEEKERNKQRVDALKKSLPAGIMSGVTIDGIGEQNFPGK